MISEKVINAILKSSSVENKDLVIKMFLDYISQGYNYNDDKCNHILEMLVDKPTVKTEKDVNLSYIENNLKLLLYNSEDYYIKNIEIERVDNIDCVVVVKFKYLKKIDEDRADITYSDIRSNISFIDYPQVLK